MFTGKKLLITGGTGSFGTAVLNRFLKTDIEEIRIFSRDEKKQEDMRIKLSNQKVKFYIGDVRDPMSIRAAIQEVDYIFHAAALKQVPSCEFFPIEALKTNCLGTENVLNEALAANVSRVVTLSTDKAVYPINAMGITKALMEKQMVAKARANHNSNTVFCGTRYGNVMASRGSVIPLFLNQILSGADLTVTDPLMTRFLMTIEDAVDLVLFAFKNANQGDIFVQKSPASTIGVLAEAMIKLFDAKSNIKIIGTRHSEKLYEALLNREEIIHAEDMGDYYRVPADIRDLNYNCYVSDGELDIASVEDYNSHNTRRLNVDETIHMLMKLDIIKNALKG